MVAYLVVLVSFSYDSSSTYPIGFYRPLLSAWVKAFFSLQGPVVPANVSQSTRSSLGVGASLEVECIPSTGMTDLSLLQWSSNTRVGVFFPLLVPALVRQG